MTPPLLDTSYVVRYLTGDPPDQAHTAALVVDGVAVALTATVLAETAHVLRSVYKIARAPIVDALVELVTKENVALLGLDRATAVEALRLCRPSGLVSVPDALTWAEALGSGAGAVYTFDQHFPAAGIQIHRA